MRHCHDPPPPRTAVPAGSDMGESPARVEGAEGVPMTASVAQKAAHPLRTARRTRYSSCRVRQFIAVQLASTGRPAGRGYSLRRARHPASLDGWYMRAPVLPTVLRGYYPCASHRRTREQQRIGLHTFNILCPRPPCAPPRVRLPVLAGPSGPVLFRGRVR